MGDRARMELSAWLNHPTVALGDFEESIKALGVLVCCSAVFLDACNEIKCVHNWQDLSHLRDVDEDDLREIGMTKVQIKRFIRVRDSGDLETTNASNIHKEIPVG
jgi:hypothetical protein